ncbi:MAG TPA: tRNA (N(6)-L-threonylcarbamoyladenosine(37)-C(2))-methylthiotransferase MtaB [Bacteroidales bacterium]|nr:tRNA (N(6)-L-threonylcarbamoyladenosine(37)-C(2))-methylthiotransferase MtaB [Bacteroidales bacterium]
MNDREKKKIVFYTLGCKLNFTETSALSGSFPEDRFERVPASSKADIYIINTCTVTEAADRKCRQAITKFIRKSPGAFIAVVGCYAQMRPLEIAAIPGVDLVLGTAEKFDVARFIENHEKTKHPEIHSCELSDKTGFVNSLSAGDRTRAFLKVQDGCDYRCSYCTVALARGGSRNPPVSTLVGEAKEIAAKGIKEIVLTGVNIGDFGKSTGETFTTLLKELTKVEGIERYRISSVEPNLLTDEIIELCTENRKLLPHFHIPLQSGSDRILALMGRRYKRELFAGRVIKIREMIPMAGIGADVIVGFPGETEKDFSETLSFLEEMPLSYLHVFTWSERPGTRAASMSGKISHKEKEKRSKILIDLSHRKHKDFLLRNSGKNAEVLFEKKKVNGMISGYTGNYIRVEHPWNPSLPGKIKEVRLKEPVGDEIMSIDIIEF